MQPKTGVKFDQHSFDRIKRTLGQMSRGRRDCLENPGSATELPVEIGLQLTNRCNLRCRHCFQWNQTGWHNQLSPPLQNEELDFSVIEKILAQTAMVQPNLYLWGGEPLCYSEWDRLTHCLETYPSWTVLCTNGIDLDAKMEGILRISPHLAILLSLDGLEPENDALRGRGSFRRVLGALDQILDLKQTGHYRGEISVNCVLHNAVIPHLYDFMTCFEAKGVNTVYFCFPWFISTGAAQAMDADFRDRFSWLRELNPMNPRSWYSYQYHLDPELIPALTRELDRLNQRVWKIRIRCQPALEPGEITPFILDDQTPAQKRSRCLAVSQRMNVLPDGTVTICKLFPEFTIGDLRREDVADLWKKPEFRRAREIIHQSLTPICSKCVLLYLHGT
jgi:sulfatase maturation enzyme AslB (radical SAM superfamily)